MEEFRQQTLRTHNTMRARHGSGPLKLSDDLNSYAQSWADILVKTDVIKHSECMLHGTRIGENIAYKIANQPQDFVGSEVVMHWYDEIKDHNFGSEDYNPKSGHFSQVVWKGVQELGVGKARSIDSKKVFVVCNYRPPGNCLGQFNVNVMKPHGQ
ncbi:Golgi-associated plant pathogenesis-related protein 1 [Elysia marginata]|uniref:Golgi-associated plant pathogenesis-related protein 1 n=1 Tax=Elysia marginata TaxID=1093978 RepID=A0AAV4EWI9_9GAST|nr:Golgi-associated plant pathogenesis-related protein 1 [Elysia marginata]